MTTHPLAVVVPTQKLYIKMKHDTVTAQAAGMKQRWHSQEITAGSRVS